MSKHYFYVMFGTAEGPLKEFGEPKLRHLRPFRDGTRWGMENDETLKSKVSKRDVRITHWFWFGDNDALLIEGVLTQPADVFGGSYAAFLPGTFRWVFTPCG